MQARGGGAIVNQSSTAAWLYSGFYGLAKVGHQRPHPAARPRARRHGHPRQRDRARARPTPRRPASRPATPRKELVKGLAIKRMGQPEDMVGACLFLLSDEAAWMTGQIVNVDGGQVFR